MVSITKIEFPEEYFCWMEQVKEDLSQLKDECFSENKNIELVALYGSLTYDYIVEFNDNNKDCGKKGRSKAPKGAEHKKAKLTQKQAEEFGRFMSATLRFCRRAI